MVERGLGGDGEEGGRGEGDGAGEGGRGWGGAGAGEGGRGLGGWGDRREGVIRDGGTTDGPAVTQAASAVPPPDESVSRTQVARTAGTSPATRKSMWYPGLAAYDRAQGIRTLMRPTRRTVSYSFDRTWGRRWLDGMSAIP